MAKKDEKTIREASFEDERLLKSVEHNYADDVTVRGRVFHVKWMHPYTTDRITCLMLREGNDNKVLAQCAALIVLNGFWKSLLLYWMLWRWFYYVRQYNSDELLPLFDMAKKKIQSQGAIAYLNATMLLTVLKDTKKMMTKAEAERTLQGLRTDKGGS